MLRKSRRNAQGSHAQGSLSSQVESLEARTFLSADTTAPVGDFVGAGVTAAGKQKYEFAIVYSDDVAVDPSTLSSSNLRVTGPNGFSAPATLVSVDESSPSTFVTGVYEITPPNGTFDSTTIGTYSVNITANQVKDTSSNPVAAGTLGTFSVNILPTSLVSGTLFLSGTPANDTISVATSGSSVIATINGTPTSFNATDVQRIQIGASAGADSITNNTSLPATVYGGTGSDTIHAGSGSDSIRGQRGPDSLVAGAGSDTLDGGRGLDTIVGGSGHSILNGERGADQITAGTAGDTLISGLGPDTLFAHNGVADVLYGGGDTTGDTAHVDAGLDTVIGVQNVLDS